jgi:hypothetical protein
MKLPARDFLLAGDLVCPSSEIVRSVWQDHVVKHPLGVHVIARSSGRDPWTDEGWHLLQPPVVTEAERAGLVHDIASLVEGKLRCEVPELRGRKAESSGHNLACSDCQAPIVVRCEKLLNAPGGVGARYASATESLLEALSGENGLKIEAARFHHALLRLWRSPEKLAGAVVLTVGLDGRKGAVPIVRISRDDGVRAEFYLERADRLRWRTTYRAYIQTRTAPQRISFLGDVPLPAPRLGRVSELCVVARRWWEAHGN